MRAAGFGNTRRAGRTAGGLLAAVGLVLAAAARADTPPPVAPALLTIASAATTVGGSVTDQALVSGVAGAPRPTGTITFKLYDVADPKCLGAPVFTSPAVAIPATGSPLLTSPAYTPTKAGTFNWIATYNGDANFLATSGKCGDTGETVAVSKASPTVTTTASAAVTVGGRIGDTATINGAFNLSGTVTFRLYGPNDANCSGTPAFTSTVGASAPTVSGALTVTVPGLYRWIATYNGDAANNTASGACTDPAEAVVVGATGTGVKTPPPPPPPSPPACDAAAMARALSVSLVATLTGTPNPFTAQCSAGVRIVLRAKEIRPGNPGFPRQDGFTTLANSLTHTSATGQVGFSFNAQGAALRTYATAHGVKLTVFAVIHVRPDKALQSTEAIQIFSLG